MIKNPCNLCITVDVRSSTLLRVGTRTGLFRVGRTVKERAELPVALPYPNSQEAMSKVPK
jgi:hypothetical protein